MLLLHVKGPRSYADLRTVNGVLYPTFHAAAVALELFVDDEEWDNTQEAAIHASANQLRTLFVTILTYGSPLDPNALFLKYEQQFCEDYKYRLGDRSSPELLRALCLNDISVALQAANRSLFQFNLP